MKKSSVSSRLKWWWFGKRNRLKAWWSTRYPLAWGKDYRAKAIKVSSLEYRVQELGKELDIANKVVDEVLPRFMRIDAFRPNPNQPGRFRLQVEFDAGFVYGAFVHGNSQDEIRYIAMRLAKQIEREMVTINFQRFEDDRDRRPYGYRSWDTGDGRMSTG